MNKMDATNRIVINTIVQYVRTCLSMVIMLISTRLLFLVLGKSDYGLYSVVGSTVFMIGFITLSLANGTQRFLSVSHGKSDKKELSNIFSNAFILHFSIAIVIAGIMWFLGPVFIGNLSISPGRVDAASFIYGMVLLMTLTSFITAPVRALYIARENIIFVSVVEVIDAMLKLAGTISLQFIGYDSLKTYSVLMMLISFFNFFAYSSYALAKYDECHVPKMCELSKSYLKRLTSFAIWNVYSVGSGVFRTQGMAVVVNRFLGTLVNAAYGIALQVNNAVSFISYAIINSVNPQLMKAEGAGNRQRMLMLSMKESKYSCLTLSLLLIPFIFEMPLVLHFWLDDVPEYAVMFCRFILITFIVDQSTIGLNSANSAIGKIRNYSLLFSTIRLLTLPAAWICLRLNLHVSTIMIAYLLTDIVIGLIRIPFMKVTAGLSIMAYCKEVYMRCILPVLCIIFVSYGMTHLPEFNLRFIVTEIAAIGIGVVFTYLFALSFSEREWIKQRIRIVGVLKVNKVYEQIR